MINDQSTQELELQAFSYSETPALITSDQSLRFLHRAKFPMSTSHHRLHHCSCEHSEDTDFRNCRCSATTFTPRTTREPGKIRDDVSRYLWEHLMRAKRRLVADPSGHCSHPAKRPDPCTTAAKVNGNPWIPPSPNAIARHLPDRHSSATDAAASSTKQHNAQHASSRRRSRPALVYPPHDLISSF